MSTDRFFIVGIGASAGGIRAIKQFFEHVPKDSGMAYVVVLHLSPEHESRLAEVLQGSATIPVAQVTKRVRVAPDHVYVIPPQKSLSLRDGHLELADTTEFEERRAPVDIFFRTLAESHGPEAACVVMSGTGANGSMGIKRVKEQGGICLVQDPAEAEYPDMPRNSMATGLIDYVLPVAEMPAVIKEYAARIDRGTSGEPPAELAASSEASLRDVLLQVRSRTGHDFANYKRPTVLRRIARRKSLHHAVDLRAYAQIMREQPREVHALLKDLLISVTSFFRDRETFEALARTVIPAIFTDKGDGDQIRVWVAGCATGEEAYSVAMLLSEYATGVIGTPVIQVFATDIDEAAVAFARHGIYTLNDAADVPPERLRRFFVKEGEVYRVRPELRDMVLFADHNLIKDPPFSHLDLVCCRNLLIYLNREAQQRVMEVMHFALRPGGYLFLGCSESIEGASDLFVTVDKEAHIFQSRAVATRPVVPVPDVTLPERLTLRGPRLQVSDESMREKTSAADLHQRLLEAYAPPSIVVNEDHDIVHLSDRAGRYLQFTGGEPSHNLLKAIRAEIRIELRTALYQAARQRTNVEAPGLVLTIGDRRAVVNLQVRPVLRDNDTARGFFLVVFQEVDESNAMPTASVATALSSGEAAQHFEEEVLRLKAQLTATIERHETQAEELKASNEELPALNEELRSSAEELETSKEELQSLNEELRTVNQELKVKVEEQTQANDDIQNLINSTEIGTIFLDRATRIKLFTPRARDIFTLIPADRGRPLSDISNALVEAGLHADIERVLDRLERVEREVRTRDGRWFLMRILPYRTADDRIDGIVLTFVDITVRTRVEEQLRASEGRVRLLIESITDYAIFTMDAEGRIDSWNPGAARSFGYEESEVLGRSASLLFTPEDEQGSAFAGELTKAVADGRAMDERWHLRKDGSRFFASGVMAPLRDSRGDLLGFVKIARDLTERKRWEEALQDAHADLEARVAQRTRELGDAIRALDAELTERRQAENQIRGLMRRLMTIQEDERWRIARDLHDHIGQQVAALGLRLDGLTAITRDPAELHGALEDARQLVGRIDQDLDFFTWQLRPAALDDLGLTVTLRNFVAEWSREFGIAAEFHSRGLDGQRTSYEVETNLYRIAQEALNNVYKHAGADQVAVLLEQRDSHLVLVVEDNGRGFDRGAHPPAAGDRGIGLLGMAERAAFVGATLEIETGPGRGTTVFVRVPVAPTA